MSRSSGNLFSILSTTAFDVGESLLHTFQHCRRFAIQLNCGTRIFTKNQAAPEGNNPLPESERPASAVSNSELVRIRAKNFPAFVEFRRVSGDCGARSLGARQVYLEKKSRWSFASARFPFAFSNSSRRCSAARSAPLVASTLACSASAARFSASNRPLFYEYASMRVSACLSLGVRAMLCLHLDDSRRRISASTSACMSVSNCLRSSSSWRARSCVSKSARGTVLKKPTESCVVMKSRAYSAGPIPRALNCRASNCSW